jgi:hypothetical protein
LQNFKGSNVLKKVIFRFYYLNFNFGLSTTVKMKLFTALVLLMAFSHASIAQFYYKDVWVTKQAIAKCKAYRDNRVKSVKLTSFEADGQATEGFTCEQTVAPDFSEIATFTRSSLSPESYLLSYYDANGLLKKTVDTGDRYQSISTYEFNAKGLLQSIVNTSIQSTDNTMKEVESHQWQYDEQGKPVSMLKIKNSTDTTFIRFIMDEKGNVGEEHAMRNKLNLPAIYYYYDQGGYLTDVVRYNEQAKRLLPDYIFEYDAKGNLGSMLTVPEDSKGYQKWIYEYNEAGLRWRESCFSKQKELLGKIEYQYNFKK